MAGCGLLLISSHRGNLISDFSGPFQPPCPSGGFASPQKSRGPLVPCVPSCCVVGPGLLSPSSCVCSQHCQEDVDGQGPGGARTSKDLSRPGVLPWLGGGWVTRPPLFLWLVFSCMSVAMWVGES